MNRRRFIKRVGVVVGASTMVRRSRAQSSPEFDYIVVGAGSAGCVVAERLSSDRSRRVLVLEAGRPTTNDPAVETPGRWVSLMGSPRNWGYTTVPEAGLQGRQLAFPRGKALGGSSAINAMTYIRGHRADFDDWARQGLSDWAYDAVLPVFRRLEDNSRGGSEYRGAGGPLRVSDCTDPHAGHAAFLEAARSLGYRADPQFDYFAPDTLNGAGYYQKNIKDGRRHSAADAFLTPALGRANLSVLTDVRVTRLQVEGHRVIGVQYVRDGQVEQARAAREVVLCAGVVDSPRLLMLSGVGPADHLRAIGVPVVADRPGVGANLQDHLKLSIRWNGRTTLPASTVTAGLFVRSDLASSAIASPDLQFYIGRGADQPDRFVTITVSLVRPHSRGVVRLQDADPMTPPVIRANYLQDDRDVRALIEGARLARAFGEASAYAALRAEELEPGPAARSDEDLATFVRRTADTIYHPAGTCRMGTDALAVVDEDLRFRGLEGLRVADASVMPSVVSATTHAASVLIGARAADLIRGGSSTQGA